MSIVICAKLFDLIDNRSVNGFSNSADITDLYYCDGMADTVCDCVTGRTERPHLLVCDLRQRMLL